MDTANLSRTVKRNMYSWHRILGIMTIIPVIFWTCSGLSHPIIAHWFKLQIAHEYIKPKAIHQEQVKLSVNEVLSRNGINLFKNFRLIDFHGKTFYQVKDRKNEIQYFSATDGVKLPGGDRLYAEYLSRYFLGDSTSKIVSIAEITSFTDEYKYINRLLPVWKVSFDRKDRMDVYVETSQSRLANYNDTNRKVFLWVFSNFHSYEFIAKITSNTARYILVLVLASIVIFSTLSGLLIYGFLWKKFKKSVTGQRIGFWRKYHRSIGIWTSIVTLTFMGSGAYHATHKFTPDDRINYVFEPEIRTRDLEVASTTLPVQWDQVSNLSLARFNDKTYYQVYSVKKGNDSWKKQQVAKAETMFGEKDKMEKPGVAYYDAADGQLLPDGIMEHSYSLVKHFVAQGAADGEAACCEMMANAAADESAPLIISSSGYLTKFDNDYGFVNKRLPVVKIALSTPQHLTYYLETATGRLAAKVQDSDRREGLSFAVFHKFLLVDFAGKNFRDFLTAFSAFSVLVVSVLGLILFIKTK
ncbi:PepSY domain-containing protein [Pedobacter sp. PAMC26386]|nr:PepSY domain-containing protein [Pedobacter sp. PAMC26386]